MDWLSALEVNISYPGEGKHKRYLDYAISESEGGRKPLRKGPWKKKQEADAAKAKRQANNK